MQSNRIPGFNNKSFDGMLVWFSEMSVRGLLFHPDDDPADITSIKDNKPLFDTPEIGSLRCIMREMFKFHGDNVYEAACPAFMNTMGIQLDA